MWSVDLLCSDLLPPQCPCPNGLLPTPVFATCTYSSFLFVCFLHDVKNVLKMYRLGSGEELRTFPLDVGSVVGFTGRKMDSEIFYYFTSFLSPGEPLSIVRLLPLLRWHAHLFSGIDTVPSYLKQKAIQNL